MLLGSFSGIFAKQFSLSIRYNPSNAVGQVFSIECIGKVASALVFDDVWQAAGVESDHRGGAGVGFDAGVRQIVLARGDHHGIGSAVERTQAEVVVQVAGEVDGEAEVRQNSLHPLTTSLNQMVITTRIPDTTVLFFEICVSANSQSMLGVCK